MIRANLNMFYSAKTLTQAKQNAALQIKFVYDIQKSQKI